MLVTIEGKKGEERLITTSRRVAADFEKEHRNVVQAIDNLIKTSVNLEIKNYVEDGSAEFSVQSYFFQIKYKDASGKLNKEYQMTRDGFMLLVMGFTGEKALSCKLRYISEFNTMEEALKRIQAERKQWEIERAKGIVVRHILTDTIKNVIPESLHKKFMYPNYTNLIYKVLFGKNAEGLRQDFKIAKGESVRDYFTADELSEVENLERLTAGLINLGWGYEQIKKFLSENVQRKSVDADSKIFMPVESKVSA